MWDKHSELTRAMKKIALEELHDGRVLVVVLDAPKGNVVDAAMIAELSFDTTRRLGLVAGGSWTALSAWSVEPGVGLCVKEGSVLPDIRIEVARRL